MDEAEFEDQMKQQKERARAARSNAKSMGVQNALLTDIKTESKYVGYEKLVTNAVLKDIIFGDKLSKVAKDGKADLIFLKLHFMPRWVDKLLIKE